MKVIVRDPCLLFYEEATRVICQNIDLFCRFHVYTHDSMKPPFPHNTHVIIHVQFFVSCIIPQHCVPQTSRIISLFPHTLLYTSNIYHLRLMPILINVAFVGIILCFSLKSVFLIEQIWQHPWFQSGFCFRLSLFSHAFRPTAGTMNVLVIRLR